MTGDALSAWKNWSGVRWLVGVLFAAPGMVVWLGTLVVSEYKYTFRGEPPLLRTEASNMIALFSLVAAGFLIVGAVVVLAGKANRNGWATYVWAALSFSAAALAIGRAAWINFVLLA